MPELPELDRTRMQQTYANFLVLFSTDEEILLDFGMRKAEAPGEVEVLQRIVLSLPHARRVRDALATHLDKVDAAMGAKENEEQSDVPATD